MSRSCFKAEVRASSENASPLWLAACMAVWCSLILTPECSHLLAALPLVCLSLISPMTTTAISTPSLQQTLRCGLFDWHVLCSWVKVCIIQMWAISHESSPVFLPQYILFVLEGSAFKCMINLVCALRKISCWIHTPVCFNWWFFVLFFSLCFTELRKNKDGNIKRRHWQSSFLFPRSHSTKHQIRL